MRFFQISFPRKAFAPKIPGLLLPFLGSSIRLYVGGVFGGGEKGLLIFPGIQRPWILGGGMPSDFTIVATGD